MVLLYTGRMGWMAHRKWKEIKQQPGTVGPGNMLGYCLVSFHFRCDIHPIRPVSESLSLAYCDLVINSSIVEVDLM